MSARSRKQIRHSPNFRMYALERPQIRQRLCACTLNFGFASDFKMFDFFAITPTA